uniref:Uncharacterized protein n=1 Tax=Arundo donax TaxID=35708 RepID=A0A0A9ESI4_ARUDO
MCAAYVALCAPPAGEHNSYPYLVFFSNSSSCFFNNAATSPRYICSHPNVTHTDIPDILLLLGLTYHFCLLLHG